MTGEHPSVAIFGAGVAALTAAHELGERGFRVLVVEPPRREGSHVDSPDELPLLLPTPCRHLLDTMKRIPVEAKPDGAPRHLDDEIAATNFGAISNGARTTFVFSPSRAASTWERYERFRELLASKLSPLDIQTLFLRMLRYHTTSSERRQKDCENISFLEYLEGRDASGLPPYRLSETLMNRLTAELKTIAGLDASWCDARSALSMLVQFHLGARPGDVSGFLHVPRVTFERAWRRHLESLGVEFATGKLTALESRHDGKLGLVVDWQGSPPVERFPGDYQIIATDVVSAEKISQPLESESGVPGELQGFTTVLRSNPRAPERSRHVGRDPTVVRNVGAKGWDRLRFEVTISLELPATLSSLDGHLCHVESPWALETTASIRTGDPSDGETGKTFVVATIHDVRAAATAGEREGKSALDCTPHELAAETWAQLQRSLKSPEADAVEPTSFQLGDTVEVVGDEILHCRSPFIVPVTGDWQNRPGGKPWVPSTPGASQAELPAEIWQAPHGGYWVHGGSVVFSGSYGKTFTRIGTLEAENESARHAVNAVLAHAARSSAESETESSAVGTYCAIWDPEAAEPPEFGWLKDLDRNFFEKGMPHAWDSLRIELLPRLMSQRAPSRDPIPDVLSLLGEMGRTSGQAATERPSEASPIVEGVRAIRRSLEGLEEQIAKYAGNALDQSLRNSKKDPPA